MFESWHNLIFLNSFFHKNSGTLFQFSNAALPNKQSHECTLNANPVSLQLLPPGMETGGSNAGLGQ